MKLENKTILLTGGTGSFGKAYCRYLLREVNPGKIIIYSRDEQKHYEMMHEFTDFASHLQFVIGDLRDAQSILRATVGVNLVVHTAAMKHMPMAEDHPLEAIKTNLLGTQNLIDACLANQVEQVIALSTDKAALPINVYGATKLILERLFITADRQLTNLNSRFSVVRYANVFGSKGSVIPLFLKLKDTGELPITHPEMSRFSITMRQGIDLVEFARQHGKGGEIIVPIAPSYTVADIAKAVCPECKLHTIGPRTAEKMHEVLVSEFEVGFTIQKEPYYVITPENGRYTLADYLQHYQGKMVQNLKEYSSGTNEQWLTIEDIQKQIDAL